MPLVAKGSERFTGVLSRSIWCYHEQSMEYSGTVPHPRCSRGSRYRPCATVRGVRIDFYLYRPQATTSTLHRSLNGLRATIGVL